MSHCLPDELLTAGAETEITSLRQRLSERNVSYTAELAKAQAGFEAALALARRDGLDKSELQSEISRLRLELSDLTKTMVRWTGKKWLLLASLISQIVQCLA